MKQKILFTSFIIFALTLPVNAKNIEVMSMSEFSTGNPPKSITIKLMEPLETYGETIEAETVIHGNLVDVTSPKRLKRDAGFSFEPVSYIDTSGKQVKFKDEMKASFTIPMDKKKVAKSAALGVGNFFVKGLSMGVAAVEGVVTNNEGNRLKSGAVSVYEASPVSYVEKGKDLHIKKNDLFYLKFPNIDKPNYEFTTEKE